MTFNFAHSKKIALEKKNDKSSIGFWDKEISGLCEKINKKKDYYTTSSCSGRIVLIKGKEKKEKGLFLFRTHNKINFKQLKKELENLKNTKELIYFKQEPCLVVIACNSSEKQQEILNKARNAGWKKSGIITIINKRIVELMSTEKISFPIMNKGEILVNDNFLKLIIKESNRKLKKTWDKIIQLDG